MNSRWFVPMIVGAAVLGWCAAAFLPEMAWLDSLTEFLKSAFLAALRMIIAPLIFFSLITGVLQLHNAQSIGRLGGVALLYYLTTTAIAAGIGLTVVLFLHPWTDYPPIADTALPTTNLVLLSPGDGSLGALFTNLTHDLFMNPFAATAQLNILGILVFAILIGLALALTVRQDSALPNILTEITQAIYKLAGWIIATLPLGLFAIAYQLADQLVVDTVAALGQLALVVFAATALHGLVVLPLIVFVTTGIAPWRFLARIVQPMITALTTSSSAATLPVSMATVERQFQVPRTIGAFVLPLGATVNMDGTALFEGVAAVFLAYMFGVDLGTTGIITIFIVAMFASIGAPGIPSGSMAGMQMVMIAVGIPLEAIALLLIIERPLDTFRTAVNVEGDIAGTLVVAKYAGVR